ncbi:molecular chaperone [Pseudomonas typographi]|uniref:molecular chaperone n=1 Tax=Pseudomonas typographi TaxID=2715964 RepID=UPI001685F487|nr:molecular chaperone [Pseudomonas typographi]MBD1589860.1 molecular chaperone [Pseudomonas typographi]
MKRLLAFAASLALLPGLALGTPKLNIGSMSDYLRADKNVFVKRIHNSGDSTAFVRVQAWELIRKADGSYDEVPLDTGSAGGQRDLVVSPARLIIPAAGMQTVRLLFTGPRAHERLFRLRFRPVVPEGGDDFQLSDAQAESYEDSLSGNVQMLAGFGSLLFVRPSQVKHQLAVHKQPGGFLVRNVGNATAVLDSFRRCDKAGYDCKPAVVHHLVPGAERVFPQQAGETIIFEHLRGADAAQPYEIRGEPTPVRQSAFTQR